MAHTPGPWHVEDESSTLEWIYVYSQSGKCIHMEASDNRRKEYPADISNAHLIAAAPELLDALRWAMDQLESDGGEDAWHDSHNKVSHKKALMAIAKAEGRS